ncbi:MAG: MFS transporter [Sphingobium sp.]
MIFPKPGRGSFPLIIVALGMAEMTCAFESSMIYMVLSSLYKEYGDPVRVGWLLTAFTLTSAGSAAICGRLGDLFGRRRVLLIMLTIALAGSLLSAFAHNLTLVIVGRAMQGSTMAVLPLCYGLLRENFDSNRMTRGVGLLGAAYALGTGAGMIAGGAIVDRFHWQGIFFVSAGAAVLAIILALVLVPRSPAQPRSGRMDIAGGVFFAPAIALILLGFMQLAKVKDGATLAIGMIASGLLMLALWARHELRHENPLIDVRLLKNRSILFANLCIFFIGIGPMLSITVVMPLLEQPLWTGTGFGLPATVTGFLKLPSNAMSIFAVIVAGYAASRYGVRPLLIMAAMVSAVGWAVIAAGSNILILFIVLQAVALIPVQTILFALTPRIVMEAAPHDRTSEATGLTQVIRALGQALGAQIMGYLLATSLVSSPHHSGTYPAASAYTLTFIAMCLFSALALAAAFALPRQTVAGYVGRGGTGQQQRGGAAT